MAPTEDRVARPEWRWGCHRGTPHTQPVLTVLQYWFSMYGSWAFPVTGPMDDFQCSAIPSATFTRLLQTDFFVRWENNGLFTNL